MRPRAAPRAGATLLAAALVLQAPAAGACGYHAVMNDLAAAHPRSIEVALAVRDALDRGDLQELRALPSALGYLRATRLLRDFQPQAAALAGRQAQSVAVLLVESGLWARYRGTDGAASPELHVAGPSAGDRVVVTSEAVLRALVDGGLAPEHAARMGVLPVDRQA